MADTSLPFNHAHFVGIGGAGMSGIAKVLHERGCQVTGSDLKESRYVRDLRRSGVEVAIGHEAATIDSQEPDVIVTSTAIPDTNPEVVRAKELNIPIWPRAKMLAALGAGRRTVAVAGTHGKTTTSSMVATMLDAMGLDPSFLIGGIVEGYHTNGRNGEGDRTDLGSAIPWLTYGLNMGAYWKGFDLQLFFQGVGGNKIYNAQRSRLEGTGMTSVLSPVMKDVWTADNPDGSIPNPKNSFNTSYPSSRFLESGSYFRLKNLQIGYSLPEKMISRAGFKSCRVYLQGSNLFTATKYSGFDPEVNGGVDNGNYPQSRSFLIGVNISY